MNKTSTPKLSAKTMTKLLGEDFRKSILRKAISKPFFNEIHAYARYLVDTQILQRVSGHEDDAKSNWGFPALGLVCAFQKDGTFLKKLMELKVLNHFLKDKDGDSAVEVAVCILVLWKQEDPSIASFDVKKIEAALVDLDKELLAQEAAHKVAEEKAKAQKKQVDEKEEKQISSEISSVC